MNGPEELSGDKAAEIFSSVLGREIKHTPYTLEFAREKMPLAIVQVGLIICFLLSKLH